MRYDEQCLDFIIVNMPLLWEVKKARDAPNNK